ncbi:right-handed parallel beta-helix repeat-containing protein [Salipiger sp. PrR002]|uniref:right-handed parallel beta-helix repeat-containing protein n=1 Tax=Salipiger sp. PrR002 TaxID=2706489 RepID=UPI0013BCBB9B|nr:right-handed parallel beta-helix repeat-containing protein [Salipiger sp. PrR002]NDW00438.1 hypothetical protein [Salipiger sp. PrR002]NDW56396.1 hypothetical protein [Salipiger sp. PrR004]
MLTFTRRTVLALAGGMVAGQRPALSNAQQPGNAIYVAPGGDDSLGNGSIEAPYQTPGRALDAARPGDEIRLRPGVYEPIVVTRSGEEGLPIVLTTLPGEERQAVISGDLQRHKIYGGAGGQKAARWRNGIVVSAQSHVQIRNLAIQDVSGRGIYVLGGDPGVQFGRIVLSGNLIRRTGNSAIMVAGFPPRDRLATEQTPRLRDVLIERNDVSETNLPNDFAPKGGRNEAISVTSSCGDIITRDNDVHDSLQYGIDYKAGVVGGEIYGNRIWNIKRYGVYLDAGVNTVQGVAVYGNLIWNCRIGIALAREARDAGLKSGEMPDHSLKNIAVFNNICRDIQLSGVYCQKHPGDVPSGEISGVRIRFNTLYNCNRDGGGNSVRLSGWDDPEWVAAGIVRDCDFVGNIVYNTDGAAGFLVGTSGEGTFLLADNLVDRDPEFVDAPNLNFSLSSASPARGYVDPGFAPPPFDKSADGAPRDQMVNAGAL